MTLLHAGTLCAAALAASLALAQGAPKIDPAKGESIVTKLCSACHSSDGNSTQPPNPVLAGQHAEYTLKQLLDFKAQDGKKPQRPHEVMSGMVAGLSLEDMRNLAAYFAAQRRKGRAARDAELARLGQAIYRGGIASKAVPACSGCHGPNGAGIPAQYPRLAGQFAEYTSGQLRAFRSGQRANDPNRTMRAIAERLNDREIAAVAEYLEGLR